jgi:hypothetical protein
MERNLPMMPISAAAPLALPRPCEQADLLDPLLRLAGELRDTHALIVAEPGVELLCGLVRRGCLAATILRGGVTPEAGAFDLVLMPRIASAEAAVRVARRSLMPGGRLVAAVRAGKPAAALLRRLRLNGFVGVCSLALPGVMLLRADLRSVA